MFTSTKSRVFKFYLNNSMLLGTTMNSKKKSFGVEGKIKYFKLMKNSVER